MNRPTATGYNVFHWNISSEDYSVLKLRKPTYRELLYEVKQNLLKGACEKILIYRYRRGEWGEWFEWWQLQGGKPIITEQGWM